MYFLTFLDVFFEKYHVAIAGFLFYKFTENYVMKEKRNMISTR